jgi:fatty acid/phospholipid biosynthesis enzyme
MLLRRTLLAALPLLLLLAIPILLKPEQKAVEPDKDAERLVIVTPHTEPVRAEFAAAFEEHYRRVYKKDIQVDYRTIGGTQFLGIKKPVIKAHGSSDALAFRNALKQASDAAQKDINTELEYALQQLAKIKENTND